MSRNLKELIRQMTLEEKAGLCSGADFWNTMGIERLGIPSVMMTDGPHGLRKQEGAADHLGLNKSVNAVCFPVICVGEDYLLYALYRSVKNLLLQLSILHCPDNLSCIISL